MKNRIKKNILLVLTGWFLLAMMTKCVSSSPCYSPRHKEVKINQKEYNQYSRRHS